MDNKYNIAEELYVSGQYEEALKIFESIEIKDEATDNYIGCCYIHLKDYKKAKDIFNKLITENSNYVRSYYNLGRIYLAEKDTGKAFRYFNTALKTDDTDPDAYYYMGMFYEKQEDYLQAIEYYQKSISLSQPDDVEPHINLSACYFAIGQYEKALSEANKAYMLCPDDRDIVFNLGLILIRMHDYDSTIKLLEKNSNLANDKDLSRQLEYCKKKIQETNKTGDDSLS